LDCGGVFALPPLLVIARETIESGGNAKTPSPVRVLVDQHKIRHYRANFRIAGTAPRE
jgi:hypothetical protein